MHTFFLNQLIILYKHLERITPNCQIALSKEPVAMDRKLFTTNMQTNLIISNELFENRIYLFKDITNEN